MNGLSFVQHQKTVSDPSETSTWKKGFISTYKTSEKNTYGTFQVQNNSLQNKSNSQDQENSSNLRSSSQDLETEGHTCTSTLPSLKRAPSWKECSDVHNEIHSGSNHANTPVCEPANSDQENKVLSGAPAEECNESLNEQGRSTASINTDVTVSMARKLNIFLCYHYAHMLKLSLDIESHSINFVGN